MTANAVLQLLLYCVLLVAIVKPLGGYMARVYQGNANVAARVFGPLERAVYRCARVDLTREMSWRTYAIAVLVFNLAGLLFVYLLQRAQGALPLNPAGLGAVSPDSSFNTAVSFASNTNWQSYGGETTMSYLTQMLGLTVQNFVSAATGMAVLVALVRAFTRKNATVIGNFWVDLVRSTLYVLLPLSLVGAIVLVSQGVVQTFAPYASASLLEATKDADGKAVTEQALALGPAASLVATDRFVYVSSTSSDGELGRCPVTGCSYADDVASVAPHDRFTVDEAAGRFYYPDFRSLRGCSFGGERGEMIGANAQSLIVTDGGTLFAASSQLCGIYACPSAGCEVATTTLRTACTAAMVRSGSRLVFTDTVGQTLLACDLPGCTHERGVLFAPAEVLALAADDRRIYWLESGGTVATCEVDGPCRRQVLVPGSAADAAVADGELGELVVGPDGILYRYELAPDGRARAPLVLLASPR